MGPEGVMMRWRKVKNFLFLGLLVSCAAVVLFPLILIITYVIKMGASSLNLQFLTQLPKPVGESGGGMAHAILGTLYLVGLGGIFAIPTGIILGTYLSELGRGWMARFLRQAIDLFTGIPSIVIGIFAYVLVVVPLKSFSALAGGAALAIIILPVVTRTTEEILKLVSNTTREAGLALGLTQTQVIWHILLKGNRAGIFTGIILAISRAAGETAPLLFTAFGSNYFSHHVMQPMASLPVQIYTYAISPFADWQRQAWAGSFVLIILVLGLNLSARFLMRAKR
jgi:phosphate transport system permease protein